MLCNGVCVCVCLNDVSNLIVVTPICLPRLSSFTMGRVGIRRFWHSRPGWHAPIPKHGCHSLLLLPLSVYLYLTHTHTEHTMPPHIYMKTHQHCPTYSAAEAFRNNRGEIKVNVCMCVSPHANTSMQSSDKSKFNSVNPSSIYLCLQLETTESVTEKLLVFV